MLRWFEVALKHLEKDPKLGELAKQSKIVERVVLQIPQPESAIEMIKELIEVVKEELEALGKGTHRKRNRYAPRVYMQASSLRDSQIVLETA